MTIAVGVLGGVAGGLLFAPRLGGGPVGASNFSLPNLLISLLGSIVFLAIVTIAQRRGRAG